MDYGIITSKTSDDLIFPPCPYLSLGKFPSFHILWHTLTCQYTVCTGPTQKLMTSMAPALPLPIASFYAGLCGILYFFMTWAIIKRRRNMKIPYGFGDDRILRKRSTVGHCLCPSRLTDENGVYLWLHIH